MAFPFPLASYHLLQKRVVNSSEFCTVQVFDVLINDEVLIPELDIFKEAGGIGVAYDHLLTFYVGDNFPYVGAYMSAVLFNLLVYFFQATW